jgi:hypothetical protein
MPNHFAHAPFIGHCVVRPDVRRKQRFIFLHAVFGTHVRRSRSIKLVKGD